MATAALDLGSAGAPPMPPQVTTDDPNQDNPQQGNAEQLADAQGIDPTIRDALKDVRQRFKEAFAPKRRLFVRRALRAFEVLKNNPYILFGDNNADFDTLSAIMNGTSAQNDVQMYQYNDNVYQMLGLAFVAALSPDVPKCRFQPVDAEDEEDILVAQKASVIQADNERRNGIKALQKLELLYLWCTGSYFGYTRNIVDKNRAGVTREPVTEMVNTPIIPNRYVCKNCSGVLPEDQTSPFAVKQRCPDCKQPFAADDYFEGYSMPVPQKTGEVETANSMTAMDVYSGLNVDADPDAQELYQSAILDLEGEMNVAAVRTAYPGMYKEIQQNETGDDATSEDTAKRARQLVTSPAGDKGAMTSSANQGTYSRCWMQPWAFAILDDQALADRLTAMFPDGVKLVTYGNTFLQAVPERMTEHWTWCPTIKGLGLYPFGVGDAALDIQVRINDCANTVHAYMDRIAFGTIFFDADVIDWQKITSKPLNPGNGTPVNRKQDEGMDKSLEDLVFQPEFHIDSKIFEYGPQLIQLAQVIAGVQPQSFGGSDPNVKTMGGQEQALKTALGRMKLFWDQIREEHAARAECSVRCTINNMDDRKQITVGGDVDADYEQITLLKNELTGDFLAYAESDEGFPSSYQEIQQRIMELMGMVAKNPFLGAVLEDPDTQKVVARYLLPDGIKLPGDRERSRLKIMVKGLAKAAPTQGPPGPDGQPALIPSIPLNDKFDDPGMAKTIFTGWLQENWQQEETNPNGFANVLAALTQASFLAAKAQAAQAIMMQQAQENGAPPPASAPPQ